MLCGPKRDVSANMSRGTKWDFSGPSWTQCLTNLLVSKSQCVGEYFTATLFNFYVKFIAASELSTTSYFFINRILKFKYIFVLLQKAKTENKVSVNRVWLLAKGSSSPYLAKKGHKVMLAERKHLYVFHDHNFLMVFIKDGVVQDICKSKHVKKKKWMKL